MTDLYVPFMNTNNDQKSFSCSGAHFWDSLKSTSLLQHRETAKFLDIPKNSFSSHTRQREYETLDSDQKVNLVQWF